MSVLQFQPHKLYVARVSDGYEDEHGDYHKGTAAWVPLGRCDAVPAAGQDSVITLDDGRQTSVSYVIYVRRLSEDLSYGDKIRVEYNGHAAELEVKGFRRYQLQCKIWA